MRNGPSGRPIFAWRYGWSRKSVHPSRDGPLNTSNHKIYRTFRGPPQTGSAMRHRHRKDRSDMLMYVMDSDALTRQVTAHALLLGDRINTAGFEGPILSNTPLAVRVGASGLAVVFRYGVVVFLGLTADQEAEFLERLNNRTFGKISPHEEEWAKVRTAKESEEPIPVGGPIQVREMSLERLLVVADALAKSVVLGRDEREVANVFDTIEPFARELARFG